MSKHRHHVKLAVGIALLAVVVTGCGFHPLYATNGVGLGPAGELAAIYVEPVPDRVGYQLRNHLLDRLNVTGQDDRAAYRLKLVLREQTQGVAIRRDASITRYNYTLSAHYELFASGTTTPLKRGDVSALAAYNVASSPFATVVAERDANERAAGDVAERIRTELAVYFRSVSAVTATQSAR